MNISSQSLYLKTEKTLSMGLSPSVASKFSANASSTRENLPSYKAFPAGRVQLLKFGSTAKETPFTKIEFPLNDVIDALDINKVTALNVLAECITYCEIADTTDEPDLKTAPDEAMQTYFYKEMGKQITELLGLEGEDLPLLLKNLEDSLADYTSLDNSLETAMQSFEKEHLKVMTENVKTEADGEKLALKQNSHKLEFYIQDFLRSLYRLPVDKTGTTALDVLEELAGDIKELSGKELVPMGDKDREYYRKSEAFKKTSNFAEDLILSAENGNLPKAFQRNETCNQLFQILSMPESGRANVLLVGEAGDGKTYLINEVANRIASGDAPENLLEAQLFSLDLGSLMAGTGKRGDYEERVADVMADIGSYLRDDPANKMILYVDEAHVLKGFGRNSDSASLLDVMKTKLMEKYRDQLSIICTTTPQDMRDYHLDTDKTFNRRFQTLNMKTFGYEQIQSIVGNRASELLDKRGVQISPSVLNDLMQAGEEINRLKGKPLLSAAMDVMDLSASVASGMPNEFFRLSDAKEKLKLRKDFLTRALATEAGKEDAISQKFTRELGSINKENSTTVRQMRSIKKSFEKSRQRGPLKIEPKHVTEALRIITGNPFLTMGEERIEKILDAKNVLGKTVKGQDEGLEIIADALMGLAERQGRQTSFDRDHPVASLLLVGPTATGKSLVTKTIAKEYFYDNLISLSMSQYKKSSSVNKILGADPGYIGFDGTESLVNQVRNNPYSVILLDEVEKAHPDVKELLLDILGEGKLTDSRGRVADFSNCVVVMTSNLEQDELRKMLAERKDQQVESGDYLSLVEDDAFDVQVRSLMNKSERGFTPEEIRRIDAVVPFVPLTGEAIDGILDNVITEYAAELNERTQLNLTVTLTDTAKKALIEQAAGRTIDVSARSIGFHAGDPEQMLQSGADDVNKVFNKTVRKLVREYMIRNRAHEEKLSDSVVEIDYDETVQSASSRDKWTLSISPNADKPVYERYEKAIPLPDERPTFRLISHRPAKEKIKK